jgi:hypothetical protein
MGIELIFGAISLAVGLVSTASSQAAARKSAAAQKEANNIQLAQSENAAREDKRQLLREERIRRARIMQSSFNSGGAGSSGESGAMGAISTNVDSAVSNADANSKANAGINIFNQKAATFDQQAREALAWGEVFQSGAQTLGNIFEEK